MATIPEMPNPIAVVTGASSGIGRATAIALAERGAHVLVHARQRREQAEETAAKIRALGREADVVLADLAIPSGQDEFVERAWSWKNRVDYWINNAGADVLTGPVANASFDEKLELLWQLDVRGTIRMTRALGRRMMATSENPSCIINLGWDHSDLGMAGDSGEMFTAAKGAVAAFSRSAAQSYAPNVRVLCVAPGWIRTAWGERASRHWQDVARHNSLARRWGTPEDVAGVISFLCSPAASFINGQVISVNGGLNVSVDGNA